MRVTLINRKRKLIRTKSAASTNVRPILSFPLPSNSDTIHGYRYRDARFPDHPRQREPCISRLSSVPEPRIDSSPTSCRPTSEGCAPNRENPKKSNVENAFVLITILQAILDSCHSGTLLDLNHYSCHWFLRRRSQCVSIPHFFFCVYPSLSHTRGYLALRLREEYAVTRHDGRPRRHTHDVWEVKLVRSATQIFRTTFSSAIKAALAIARLRILLKQRKNDVTEDSDERSPGLIKRSPCGGLYCAYALSNGPLVVCHSSPFFVVRIG